HKVISISFCDIPSWKNELTTTPSIRENRFQAIKTKPNPNAPECDMHLNDLFHQVSPAESLTKAVLELLG
ncbi:MAG: hypothetical protein KDA45_07465, partial [Planctomycetales bacterium]|nr:hypothetical protein [Planctomycetales bacterium]